MQYTITTVDCRLYMNLSDLRRSRQGREKGAPHLPKRQAWRVESSTQPAGLKCAPVSEKQVPVTVSVAESSIDAAFPPAALAASMHSGRVITKPSDGNFQLFRVTPSGALSVG